MGFPARSVGGASCACSIISACPRFSCLVMRDVVERNQPATAGANGALPAAALVLAALITSCVAEEDAEEAVVEAMKRKNQEQNNSATLHRRVTMRACRRCLPFGNSAMAVLRNMMVFLLEVVSGANKEGECTDRLMLVSVALFPSDSETWGLESAQGRPV